ncbi:MAG TPA: hypothetical protein VH396_18785 [Chitinophagaceae bacterium]|jgi:hypothetical protein
MKTLFAIFFVLFICTSSVFANVNEKLLYSFSRTFPSAENVKWSEDAIGYFVSFTQSGIPSKVAYDTKGNFLYAMRYYNEEGLPVSILLALKKKFTDKKISGVTESTTPDNIIYHVKLEDEKNWYTVGITTSGDSAIEEQFKK